MAIFSLLLRIISRFSYFPTFGIIILILVSTSLTITYEEAMCLGILVCQLGTNAMFKSRNA